MDLERSENWACPKCAKKNLLSRVNLKQINSGEAIYICEGSHCLYPLEALKKFPIITREVGAMPVPVTLLRSLNLPESLSNEPNLTESCVNELIVLNSLKCHSKNIYETKNSWESFVREMLENGEDVPSEITEYNDADLEKLENIEPTLLPFMKHIFSSNKNS